MPQHLFPLQFTGFIHDLVARFEAYLGIIVKSITKADLTNTTLIPNGGEHSHTRDHVTQLFNVSQIGRAHV